MQIMYGIDGRRDLTESTRDDLSGYAGARPVRIGNGAFDQRQNDVFGAVLDSILLHTRRSERLPRRIWPVVEAQATCASKVWSEPGPGDLGGARRTAALRLLKADVLGRDGPCGEARRRPRRSRPRGRVAEDRRRDQGRHPGARPPQGRRPAAALRDRLARRLDAPGRDLRIPSRRRRTAARVGARDRGRAHGGRLRPALQDRRDRRRALGQGGQLPDLLVLAGLGARGRGRARSGRAT